MKSENFVGEEGRSAYWKVAVAAPISEPLTYAHPDSDEEIWQSMKRGTSVIVPLGRRRVSGVVMGPAEKPPDNIKIKGILEFEPEKTQLDEATLKWIEWLAQYYLFPVGMVADLMFPPLVKKGRGSRKSSVVPVTEKKTPHNLTADQSRTVDDVLSDSGFKTHLIYGVTGSGKTEVYLSILEHVLAKGQQGLVIVPEISLTPQLITRFLARFGDQVAVLHSQLTERERTDQWWSVVAGEKTVLIGARSALFCPLPRLGLIVVDEEHEPSFKQDEKLKYNGRDAAIMRAKILNIPILLGSATPSLESWRNAEVGRYRLHELSSRASSVALPEVTIVDLKLEPKEGVRPFWLSGHLHSRIRETLGRNEQVALFLNRRGVANTVLCHGCGQSVMCPNCAVSLTLHGRSHLVCHYCDYHDSLSRKCSSCSTGELKGIGIGTEQIEADLRTLFPQARLARADRDEIQTRQGLEDLIRQFETGETDILIGTQMIAKGLDFPNLNLVGIVLADIGFSIPDFRATERSFQLLTQVAGRAGRRKTRGEVIIQTMNPNHPSVVFAKLHDYRAMATSELPNREELLYPPFGLMACVRVQAIDARKALGAAEAFAERARSMGRSRIDLGHLRVLGPVEAPLSKLRGNYRFQVLLKADRRLNLSVFCREVLGDESWVLASVKLQVDIDPLNMM